MNTPFSSMVVREWRLLFRDPWLFSLISWIPILISFLLWAIFSGGIARDLPIGVVDLDHSRMSRALIRLYDASPALATNDHYNSTSEGAQALRAGKIYGVVVIPKGLEKESILGRPPQVSAFINSQFLLIGKNINSALLTTHSTFSTGVEIIKSMSSGTPVFSMALPQVTPIGNQVTPLFNVNNNYAQFLVSAILPALWQILLVAAIVLSFAAEQRREGLKQWLGTTPIKAVLAKYIPLTLIFWLHGLLFLWAMYVLLGWPMHGNWTLLLFAQLLTVCASLIAGSIFFFITLDATRGLSLAAAYAAPGLAFMGVTFPITDMTLPAKIWRSFLPISHYITIQLTQINYGSSIHTAIPYLLHLGLFFIPLLFVFYRAIQLSAVRSDNEASQ